MATEKQLVEIKRVISNDEGINTSSRLETIDISDIKGFRAWHKGAKDAAIKGDMTILKVKDVSDPNAKPKTVLIEESYDDFLNRMSSRVEVRSLMKDAKAS